MISEDSSEIDQLIMEVKEPQVEFIDMLVFLIDISKTKSQHKEHFAPAKTTCEIELHQSKGMKKTDKTWNIA